MKFKILLLIAFLISLLVVAGCGVTPGKSLAGHAFDLGGGKQCLDKWYYDEGGGKLSGPFEECTAYTTSENNKWCGITGREVIVYMSGGIEGVDWQYCSKDRKGKVSTLGCTSGKWYYDEGEGQITEWSGCTEYTSRGQPWCVMDSAASRQQAYVAGGVQGEDWDYCGKKSLIISGLPILPSIEKEKVDETTAYGKLYMECFDLYVGCDTTLLNSILKNSPAFGTDFAKFVYIHKQEVKSLGMNPLEPESIVNVMYKGLSAEEARAFAALLLVEEVERKKAKEKALLDWKTIQVVDQKVFDETGEVIGGKAQNKLQYILDKLLKNQLGSKDWELENKGEEETDILAEAKAGIEGKSDFLSNMGSCLQSATGWNVPGKGNIKRLGMMGGKGGSTGGGVVQGGKQGQISQGEQNAIKTLSKTPKKGVMPEIECTDNTKCVSKAAGKIPKSGQTPNKDPGSPDVGGDGLENSQFSQDQAQGKQPPCEAVNWAKLLGDGSLSDEQKEDKGDKKEDKDVGYKIGVVDETGTQWDSQEVTTTKKDKDGNEITKTESHLVSTQKTKDGKAVTTDHGVYKTTITKNSDKSTQTKFYSDVSVKDQKGQPIKDSEGKNKLFRVADGFEKQKDEKGNVQDSLYDHFDKSYTLPEQEWNDYTFSGTINPLADVSKSKNPYQMCKGAMGGTGAGGACIDAAIEAEFKTLEKSVQEENCEKVGQFGPDGGSCGKKTLGEEGLDKEAMDYGTSTGKGVTDPSEN